MFQEIELSPDDAKLEIEIDSLIAEMQKLQKDKEGKIDMFLQEIATGGTNRQLAHRGVYDDIKEIDESISSKKEKSLAKCAEVSNKEYAKKYLEVPILDNSEIPQQVVVKMRKAGLVAIDNTLINPGLMGKPEIPI